MKPTDKNRVICQTDLLRLIPLSRTQIWRLEKAGEFPSRIRIGRRRVGYLLTDIEAWIASRRAEGRRRQANSGSDA